MDTARTTIKGQLTGFYDRNAVDYHRTHYVAKTSYSPLKQRQLYIEEMIDALKLPRGARILDVGCGPGELLLTLLKRGYDAVGIDISQGMIDVARSTIRSAGFADFSGVSVGDIEKLTFQPQTFDVVVASGVIEYQKDDRAALEQMTRVLKPGGYLIVNVTNRYSFVTMSENVYKRVKTISAVRRALSVARRLILRDGTLTDIPWNRTHAPGQFDRELQRYGFQKITHNFFRFSPVPVPLDSLYPSGCRAAGSWMERFSRRPLGILGGGYIVMARKQVES
jgi:ubiquinone/menaquinone biosynthesis C-methylase UbiE